MKNAIEVTDLVKKYKDGFQLGEIDITIPSGIIVGVIGENGAGKTTLIKSLLGIVKADKGRVKVFGKDYEKYEQEIKEDIGVVLDDMFFPEVLNANDINSAMKDIYRNWDSNLFFQYLKEFDLPAKKSIKKLSKGMRKKLEIITALSHKPKLLVLDEPTSGLDPVVRNEILDLFLKFIRDEDHTVFLSTHITTDLERVADEIIFIDQGKKILDDAKDNIIDNYVYAQLENEDSIRYVILDIRGKKVVKELNYKYKTMIEVDNE